MEEPITKEQWQSHFYHFALQQYLKEDQFAKEHNSANWIFDRKVNIYHMQGVSEEAITQVALGIEDLLKELFLNFEIVHLGTNRRIANYVALSAVGARIDVEKLSERIVLAKKDKPESVVLIAPQYLSGGDEHWGYSTFTRGCSFIAVPSDRQKELDFLRRLAKHEAGHLFGYETHHDENNVIGYDQVKDCNMLWRASTADLCDKCKDAMIYFWKGIEDNAGEKFFKQ